MHRLFTQVRTLFCKCTLRCRLVHGVWCTPQQARIPHSHTHTSLCYTCEVLDALLKICGQGQALSCYAAHTSPHAYLLHTHAHFSVSDMQGAGGPTDPVCTWTGTAAVDRRATCRPPRCPVVPPPTHAPPNSRLTPNYSLVGWTSPNFRRPSNQSSGVRHECEYMYYVRARVVSASWFS